MMMMLVHLFHLPEGANPINEDVKPRFDGLVVLWTKPNGVHLILCASSPEEYNPCEVCEGKELIRPSFLNPLMPIENDRTARGSSITEREKWKTWTRYKNIVDMIYFLNCRSYLGTPVTLLEHRSLCMYEFEVKRWYQSWSFSKRDIPFFFFVCISSNVLTIHLRDSPCHNSSYLSRTVRFFENSPLASIPKLPKRSRTSSNRVDALGPEITAKRQTGVKRDMIDRIAFFPSGIFHHLLWWKFR